MKYLVMESATSYAVLLDEDGRFVKSANLGYEIGDTVTNPVLMLDTPLEKINGRSKVTNRVIATVVAIAAMVMLIFGVNYYQQSVTPYSSIFMAINPEVEMVLNKSGDVIDMNGINEDGRTLLEKYYQTSKDKSVIANGIVDRAIEMGYLADGGRVSIAIDTPDQALFEQYGAELRRVFEGRESITFSITDVDNRNQEPEETSESEIEPEPEVEPEVEAVPADDSGYDESSYEAPVVEEPAEPESPAPSVPTPPAPTTPVQEERPATRPSKPAPKPNPAPEKPVTPAPNPNPAPEKPVTPSPKPPKDESDYDTDYDESDYDDSDYDDTDYDSDYDDSDYNNNRRPNRRPNKGKRNKNSYKDNNRNKNGRSTEQNSSKHS